MSEGECFCRADVVQVISGYICTSVQIYLHFSANILCGLEIFLEGFHWHYRMKADHPEERGFGDLPEARNALYYLSNSVWQLQPTDDPGWCRSNTPNLLLEQENSRLSSPVGGTALCLGTFSQYMCWPIWLVCLWWWEGHFTVHRLGRNRLEPHSARGGDNRDDEHCRPWSWNQEKKVAIGDVGRALPFMIHRRAGSKNTMVTGRQWSLGNASSKRCGPAGHHVLLGVNGWETFWGTL